MSSPTERPSRAVRPAPEVPADIQALLSRAGLRRTLATRAAIGLFLARPAQGLTHAQVLAALQARGAAVNRVTLYRLLDRLAAIGVLQRYTDDDRTWRFSLADRRGVADGPVPRFECDACHRQFRLTEASEPTRAVAADLKRALEKLGHQAARVDLAVHGTCAHCAEPGAEPGAAEGAGDPA